MARYGSESWVQLALQLARLRQLAKPARADGNFSGASEPPGEIRVRRRKNPTAEFCGHLNKKHTHTRKMSAIGVVSVNSNSTAALLTQLAAKGAQDVLLTCDPKCSLFHQSYCRITNFSMGEQTLCFQQAPSGQEWVASTAIRAEVLRAGDLLGPVYVDGALSGLPRPVPETPVTSAGDPALEVMLWTPAVSYALVSTSQVLIGSQEFETIPSEYMIMHDEISRTEGCRASKLIGDYGPYLRGAAISATAAADANANQYQGLSVDGSDEATLQAGIAFSTRSQKIIAPLPHFWTSHAGNYLNVVGSQYHNIVLQLSTRAYSQLALALQVFRESGQIKALPTNLIDGEVLSTPIEILDSSSSFGSNMGQLSGLSILAVYVQLDTAERRLKAQAAQTVRMVYVQSAPYSTVATDQASTKSITNYFNHPVTRFLWAWRATAATAQPANQQWFRFGAFRGSRYSISRDDSPLGYYPVQEAVPEINEFELQINNHSRTNQAAEYYLYTQPYALGKRVPTRIIYSYSFAQYPDAADMHSGSMNLSRIDNVVLNFTFKTAITSDSHPVAGANTFLAASDSIAEANSVQCGYGIDSDVTAEDVRALSTAGTIFFCAETINFYKQAAGMFGLLLKCFVSILVYRYETYDMKNTTPATRAQTCRKTSLVAVQRRATGVSLLKC